MHLKDQKAKRIVIAMGLLIVILAVVIIVLVAGNKNRSALEEGKADTSVGEFVPAGMKYVNDLYSGQLLIPDYDIPLSSYDTGKFTAAEGRILYEGAVTGVDVSDHQREIDWKLVKESGISFAIIRVGYRGFTQGSLMEDERFSQNIQGALENDIDVGVYFFSQAVSEAEAVEEADYVIERIQDYKITYPIVYDWEHITNAAEGVTPRTAGVTLKELTAFTKAFCDRVQERGYAPMFYSNKSMAYSEYHLESLNEYNFWLAEYQPAPCFYYDFQMWQYTESGVVSGIPVQVDLNLSWKSNF